MSFGFPGAAGFLENQGDECRLFLRPDYTEKPPGCQVGIIRFPRRERTIAGPLDALVPVLDSEAVISIAGEPHRVRAGETFIMPAGKPHALSAGQSFKMLLVMIRA